MVIIFDLDDTLYEEMTYVQSGFRVVSTYLSQILNLSTKVIFNELIYLVKEDRNFVFNRFLEKRKFRSQQLVKECVRIYRGHDPQITLYPEAKKCLKRFQKYPLYIVTDGNKIVQRKKFLALGLDHLVDRCFFTYAHGLHRSKPSPYCFEKICKIEKVKPRQVVYVADNPTKDFVGIKPLGFHTIRILKGQHAHLRVDAAFEAEICLPNLAEFNEKLLDYLMNKG